MHKSIWALYTGIIFFFGVYAMDERYEKTLCPNDTLVARVTTFEDKCSYNLECCICFECEPCEELLVIPCTEGEKHSAKMCRSCLDQYKKNNIRTCPICRQPLALQDASSDTFSYWSIDFLLDALENYMTFLWHVCVLHYFG